MRSQRVQRDILCCCVVLFAGCTTITTFGNSDSTGGESGGSGGGLLTSTTGIGSGGLASDSESSSSTQDASSSDASDDSGTEGNSFITDDTDSCGDGLPDGVLAHCSPTDCSVIAQNCPAGEACRPWANDGSSTWNAARCTPIEADPGQADEACTVQGSGSSGVDSCDAGLLCWEVDADTLEGTCIEMCSGSLAEPVCSNADDVCGISNQGVLALCLPSCELPVDDCDADEVCVPMGEDTLVCISERYAKCPAGTIEVAPIVGLGCTQGEPCCSPYCDLAEDASCARGLECVPLSEPNPAHPDVGVCGPVR